jgi:hypothetical protein
MTLLSWASRAGPRVCRQGSANIIGGSFQCQSHFERVRAMSRAAFADPNPGSGVALL